MEIFTVAKAKPKIGRLVDRALRGEPVLIRKGNRMVALTEFVVPEPIPERPVGYFSRQPDGYAAANHSVVDVNPVR